MGQDPQELRYEIERQRADMSETLDAIGDRVSPGRIIERRKNRVSQGFQSMRERMMGTVSDGGSAMSDAMSSVGDQVNGDALRQRTEGSPLGVGLVTFGIGFLAAAAMPPSRAEQQAASKLQDQAEPLKQELTDAAKQVGEGVKEQVDESRQQIASTASGAAQQVKESAQSAAAETKDEATGAAQDVRST